MAVITFPDTLYGAQMRWGQKRNELTFRSPFGSQTQEITSPLWLLRIQADSIPEELSGEWKALVMSLCGQTHQLACHDLGRPVPLGTMRGSMTLNAPAAAGATSIQIVATGQNSKTILKSDLLGLGSGVTQHVVMSAANSTSNGSGQITVNLLAPLRNAFSAGTVVTWDKPKALFRRRNTEDVGWDYDMTFTTVDALDLIEDVRPS